MTLNGKQKPTNLYLTAQDLDDIELLADILDREGVPLADPRGGRKKSKSALVRHLVKQELIRRGIPERIVKNPTP